MLICVDDDFGFKERHVMMMICVWWWCYDDDDVMMMSSYSDVNFFGICENPYQNKKMWVFQWDWKKIKWDCDVLLPSLI